jgi:hypothetical protein
MDDVFCSRCPDILKSLGRLEKGQEDQGSDLKEIAVKLDALVSNGSKRDTATAVRDATHETEQRVTLKERRWVHWVLISAGGAIILIIVQTLLPKILKALAEALR